MVCAHPDDEILGAGGTLIKHSQQGDEIHCLILGEGATSRAGSAREEVETLRQEAKAAGEIIGFKDIYFCDFKDNSFDTLSLLEITKVIEKHLALTKPDIIFTHHEYDLNIDHRLAFQGVLTACRPLNPDCPKEIYAFETLSSTEWQSKDHKQFCPNVYFDIENVLDKKIEAINKYATELRKYPHPRSGEGIKILAQYRGLEAGMRYAEAFCLIRKIAK